MTCVDKMPKVNVESEMEEGEIVDELDDLSDISSEEEFLLRQRLEVLENYNNVLERKKAKRSSSGPGTKSKRDVLCDLSEVSELEDPHTHATYKQIKVQRHVKPHSKQRRRKENNIDENNIKRKKDNPRKKSSRSRKKLGVKVISETSDESEDEYRNKRKKLADAVIVPRVKKSDKTSLSARLHNMIHGSEAHINLIDFEHKHTDSDTKNLNIINEEQVLSPVSSSTDDPILSVDLPDGALKDKKQIICELIEVSTDEEVKAISIDLNQEKDKAVETDKSGETEESILNLARECQEELTKECQENIAKDSDDDLESLRQHALKSKTAKPKAESNKIEDKILSEDEDSDTAELRLICLKSALLKKAIEMKQKQKLQKRLSQSSTLEDDLFNDRDLFPEKADSANNTDIESVDMDMGSDAEEKTKECNGENDKLGSDFIVSLHDSKNNTELINCAKNNFNIVSKEDEIDDDEDLLRAKLLTSLSKNLTNLVNPEILHTIDKDKNTENPVSQPVAPTVNLAEAKKFIIKLDGSDSEGEHEATKNLTKMHMKLSEQKDFQQQLDLFLKSTRMEVEMKKLPDVQNPLLSKKPNKFVAKAVNNLPKSEQMEYKNLVRRMAELEKMKQTRQATMKLQSQQAAIKRAKQRNVTIETQVLNSDLEEQIAKSRKTIAEESVKMLKLKEEATKLSQRYKIAATELRNISTAITLNKKQQRAIQNSLTKIRLQHQSLLKSSTTSIHSKINGPIPHLSHLSNKVLSNKLQIETNPKDEYKNPQKQKTVKISVVNDFVDEAVVNTPRLSVQLDVANNKKVVKIPTNEDQVIDTVVEVNHNELEQEQQDEKHAQEIQRRLSGNNDELSALHVDNKLERKEDTDLLAVCDHGNKRYYISVNDYKSPLSALGSSTWQADPNAILCPFEVGGQCKDPDCKYLHTPTPVQ